MAPPKAKTGPALIAQYVTKADRTMAEWHLLLRRATFGAAIVLMLASIVSLHWACVLIGLPDQPYAPVAWIVPLAMEVGMASVASTATTIRKKPKAEQLAEGRPGGYYLSLWAIFTFIMALAQAANIGHAMSVIETRLATANLPAFIPEGVIYGFASAFAALFPLGGTLLIHVSGFLREYGAMQRVIGEDAELVYVEDAAAGHAPIAQPTRPSARPASPTATRPAATPAPRPADAPTAPAPRPAGAAPATRVEQAAPAGSRAEAEAAVLAEYRSRLAEGDRMDGKEIAERLGMKDTGNARTLRLRWDRALAAEFGVDKNHFLEHAVALLAGEHTPAVELAAAAPAEDPIEAQVDVTAATEKARDAVA